MIAVGTAGWVIARTVSGAFASDGSHLQRYASTMSCVEINSSFYRPHRTTTYARWAAATPAGFRFAVKLPRTITHEARLARSRDLLDGFLEQVAGLGDRLGVLLVQLPPSLALAPRTARAFFARLRDRHDGAVVVEPRHASWFEPAADRLLVAARVTRVAADPARVPAASKPGGWLGIDGDGRGATPYYRWHGSPRMYWSPYDATWLEAHAAELRRWPSGANCWAIFDNTAGGAALPNALQLTSHLSERT